ncbi:sn-glycerol-1-phosphate dehydrogenase [Propionicicella superfundia]|uniref:sn-glycerol-1-phosphate dehydrogenase n=1 Tax=Propionicicella superfundia TaxID=348582 RepID=UPI00040B2CF4|nr:sn-glycerol-1-phosphate dehydrogenase [Propionicicella superfundia]
MSELIERALQSAHETKQVISAAGALDEVASVFSEAFPGATAIVIGDERTMAAAGDKVAAVLAAAGVSTLDPYVFPGEPELYAKYENVELLRGVLEPLSAVAIAVGGGSLNDLVKRTSGELGRPYMVVATAASMDGYTAFGASIAKDGYKNTLNCPAPVAAVADIDVLAAAPSVMTASGYGDLIGKVPAGADWLIADALGVEAVDKGVWDLVQGPLRTSLSRPDALAAGDADAVAGLAEGLLMSGLAMQAHQSSRPASGAEHQFSHLWEMEGHGTDIKPRRLSHGFKVALGTVSIAALYEILLATDLTRLDIDAAVRAWPTRSRLEEKIRRYHSHPQVLPAAIEQTMAKYIEPADLAVRLHQVVELWPTLKVTLADQLIGAAELQKMLRAAGAPAHPDDIRLGWGAFKDTYVRSQMIRKRYTVLDLALEANLLDGIVEELFAADGFWGTQQP